MLLDELVSSGRYHFTLPEAVRKLGRPESAARAALRRLKSKGHLSEPGRGFFVIVPPEYRRLGCLPAAQFIPHLMDYWGEFYYVALLSAAENLGSAHQRPQVFQVMLSTNHRPVECGQVRVEFIARRDLYETPVLNTNTPRGHLRVSSAEATALELVGYYDRCGGLNNVATVLAELAERISGRALQQEAKRCPLAWVQRLGYLLEFLELDELATEIQPIVARAREEATLSPSHHRLGAPRSKRWKLAINVTVEPDL